MDRIFLGVLYVVPGSYTWFFCRKSTGTIYRAPPGNKIHAKSFAGSLQRYCCYAIAICFSEKGSNATINQLKSSGSLRLIRKEFVADSIVQYDIWSQRLMAVEENIKEVIQEFRSSMGNVLNASALKV